MATMWEHYRELFLKQPGYNTVHNFGVRIKESEARYGDYHWEVIGAHLLTPKENGGKQILAIDVVGADGVPIRDWKGNPADVSIKWGWEGQRSDEQKPSISLAKPIFEYGCDIAVHAHQVVWCRVVDNMDSPSQTVEGFRTDKEGPGDGNSWGHWSIFVVFQWKIKEVPVNKPPVIQPPQLPPEPNPDPEPEPEPPSIPTVDTLTDDEMGILKALTEVWDTYETLPKQTPGDPTAFVMHIHGLQRIIMARPTWRSLRK
jgi:hypothetical protein